VKDLFIDRNPWTGFSKKDFVFVPSSIDDNRHLLDNDPNYVRRLESISDSNLRKALRFGDWNVFDGQFFPEYTETIHCVPMMNAKKIDRTILCLDY
jgi:phage terminase large subunit